MQSSERKPILITLLTFVCASLFCVNVYGQVSNSANSFARLQWIPDTGNSGAIANSSSVMTRYANGVAYTISTVGLVPGGAYTNWWVIFNNPQFCSPPGCSGKDFPQNGGDPKVQASVLWATGRVADAGGQGNFSAQLAAGGVSAAPGQILFGPGLLNPSRAEIHIIVRSHGFALWGSDLVAQLTTVAGGCALAGCQDQQFVMHLP